MPVDCLTVKMKPDVLRQILDSNMWDPMQTADAKAQKAGRQLQRQRKPLKPSGFALRSSDPDDELATED